jgi:hypothetical protein
MRALRALRNIDTWGWLMLGVSLLGLALRVEHALTFDQVHRASDYTGHLPGVRWMQEHWRPFFHDDSVNYGVRSYPPLWYLASALLLELHDNERLLVVLSLLGFVARHAALWLILRQSIPRQRIAQLCAIGIHALLPLGVLIDGKVNPEAMHSGIFALALWALWRLERRCQSSLRVPIRAGAAFGALAGLALLAKITGGLLVVVGAAVFASQALLRLRRDGLRAAWRALGMPALAAGGVWLLVAGWWSGTNLVKFGHPFPHVWDLETAQGSPVLANPAMYRRPLGWALPFEWKEYWRFPLLQTTNEPRPNFWATEITGTWSDIYNRGFCRLTGGGTTDHAWGGRHGFLSQDSDAWSVTLRCVDWFAGMLHVGVWITAAAVLAVLWCLWRHLRSWGAEGSLALPLTVVLCTGSGMWFALAYPYDHIAALNPRYLLSQVMPMSACLGLGLARLETARSRPGRSGLAARCALGAVATLIALIGAMLVYERFGW